MNEITKENLEYLFDKFIADARAAADKNELKEVEKYLRMAERTAKMKEITKDIIISTPAQCVCEFSATIRRKLLRSYVYTLYLDWCTENGVDPVSRNELYALLLDKAGFELKRENTGQFLLPPSPQLRGK